MLPTNKKKQKRKDKKRSVWYNKVYYSDSKRMSAVPNECVNLIVTSPPYFNIKDYSKDGYQNKRRTRRTKGQIGDAKEFDDYKKELLEVWKECERVLTPNGKLIINVPLMPMLKSAINTHYNRHIFDINAEIEMLILNSTALYLYDIFIWNRKNL